MQAANTVRFHHKIKQLISVFTTFDLYTEFIEPNWIAGDVLYITEPSLRLRNLEAGSGHQLSDKDIVNCFNYGCCYCSFPRPDHQARRPGHLSPLRHQRK